MGGTGGGVFVYWWWCVVMVVCGWLNKCTSAAVDLCKRPGLLRDWAS